MPVRFIQITDTHVAETPVGIENYIRAQEEGNPTFSRSVNRVAGYGGASCPT